MSEERFCECAKCADRTPGKPLCDVCQHNQRVVCLLLREVADHEDTIERLTVLADAVGSLGGDRVYVPGTTMDSGLILCQAKPFKIMRQAWLARTIKAPEDPEPEAESLLDRDKEVFC